MIKNKLRSILKVFIIFFFIIVVPKRINAVTILLDPGHGAHDVGAVDKVHNIYEKDINLKLAKYLKEYLEEYQDTNILLTRNDDTFLEVFDRGIMAREKNADILISLHINSIEGGNLNGAEVYVSNNTSLPKYKEETSKLGEKILANLASLGIANRGVRTRLIPTDATDIYTDGTRADYYGVIRYAMRGCRIDSGVIKPDGAIPAKVEQGEGVPAIIIEHCYINSSIDYEFFNTDEDIKKLAKADADAIVEHYNLAKKTKVTYKIEDNDIVVLPEITIENIKETYPTAELLENQIIATGNKILIDENEYTVIVKGDVNGDGETDSLDALKILKYDVGILELEDYYFNAADVNNDNVVDSLDALKILKYDVNLANISI